MRAVESWRWRQERKEEDNGVGKDGDVVSLRVEHVRLRAVQSGRDGRHVPPLFVHRRTAPAWRTWCGRGRSSSLSLGVAVRTIGVCRQFPLRPPIGRSCSQLGLDLLDKGRAEIECVRVFKTGVLMPLREEDRRADCGE